MKKSLMLIVLMLALLLTGACKATATPSPTPTPNAQELSTSIASTVAAELTAVSVNNPSQTPEPSVTPVPTDTPTPTAAVSLVPPESPVVPAASPTNTATAAVPAVGATLANHAEFVSDITVPDGTVFAPGEKFVKTWRIRNIGSATWTKDYSFVFINGEGMGGQPLKLPSDIPSGTTVDISIEMTAPTDPGEYNGYWMFQDKEKNLFGIGSGAAFAVFVNIKVVASAPSATPTPTGTLDPSAPTATETPTPTITSTPTIGASPTNTATPKPTVSSGSKVTAAVVTLDTADFTGTCPHTFNVNVTLTLSGPASVEAQLNASTTDPGYTLVMPGKTVVTSAQTGTHDIYLSYALTLQSSVTGKFWIDVSVPNIFQSNKINFSLDCQ